MHWDVVEVKPETDYRLFVRFKDGLSGHVQLRRETLTGALAPLLDAQFFRQVFVDEGAVAWPGEIDLAPDAMYAEVSFRNQLPRLYELSDLLEDPSHPDAYNFQSQLRNPLALETYALWEKELKGLDSDAWVVLKSKASRYLEQRDRNGRGWYQLFDALGEAFAYNYVKDAVGCPKVCFVPESDNRTPDLEGLIDDTRVLCEVKTINESDEQIAARRGSSIPCQLTGLLEDGFFNKLDSNIANAKDQFQTFDPNGEAQYLVYVRIRFDHSSGEWPGHYAECYLKQIEEHLRNHPPGIKVVVNAGASKEWTRVVA